jgi:hypothetical protein
MSTACAQSESAPGSATTATERPAQPPFSETEQKFLQNYLDDYLTAEPSNTKKGDKKRWVKEHVYYKYISEFTSDGPSGPNLSSLFDVRTIYKPQEDVNNCIINK